MPFGLRADDLVRLAAASFALLRQCSGYRRSALGRQFVVARVRASNWLVRASDEGLFIHFRSYLNDYLSPGDSTVVSLLYQDIRSARLVKERTNTIDSSGGKETQYRRYIEFELAVDPGRSLRRSRQRMCATRDQSQTLVRQLDDPLSRLPCVDESPPYLRLAWNVVRHVFRVSEDPAPAC